LIFNSYWIRPIRHSFKCYRCESGIAFYEWSLFNDDWPVYGYTVCREYIRVHGRHNMMKKVRLGFKQFSTNILCYLFHWFHWAGIFSPHIDKRRRGKGVIKAHVSHSPSLKRFNTWYKYVLFYQTTSFTYSFWLEKY